MVDTKKNVKELETEVEYRTRLQEICSKIYAAMNLDEIILNYRDEIIELFTADRITIYYVDGIKRELVSRIKSGNEVNEIRVPISPTSISGFSVHKKQLVNISDVYNTTELKKIDPALEFDSSWDRKTGFRTKQVLVVPIMYKTFMLGALQFINRKDSGPFSKTDESFAKELAKIMGIAMYNQKRMAKTKTRSGKFDYLLENHILTQKELSKAVSYARNNNEHIENVLVNDLKIQKKDVGMALSKYYKVQFLEFNDKLPIPGELLTNLKVPFMKTNFWVPIRSEDQKIIVIAIDDPHDGQKIGEIKTLFPGKSVKMLVSFRDDIIDYINNFTQDEKELSSIDDLLSQMDDEEDEMEEMESGVSEESSAVVQLVNKIIIDAHNRNASDIHIEPFTGKDSTKVRIRCDGSCTVYQTIPYQYRSALISRLKIMADLDIAERRKPQDGKIGFKKYGGLDIELRVATVPTQGGVEDVVMRILAAGEPIPLDKMGFSDSNYENFVGCITKPYGIIFVCGPTGSGKTTTLHSALGYINKDDIKIWTAEDPVEITQKGLRQVQVKPKIGFDFAAAMRAFLRADPDVIMVGEMRDKETTHIGIEASLTGHLVFSTLHTNSAPESITRLLDMGMDPFNFADAILCILAQRLVRTLCGECKAQYTPTEDEFNELVREYDPEAFEKNMGMKYSKEIRLYRPEGCDSCNNTGYKGRMGLHELLLGTDEMKKLIQSNEKMEGLRNQAISDGMTTLKQDGIDKIFKGKCDLLQVRKVCIK